VEKAQVVRTHGHVEDAVGDNVRHQEVGWREGGLLLPVLGERGKIEIGRQHLDPGEHVTPLLGFSDGPVPDPIPQHVVEEEPAQPVGVELQHPPPGPVSGLGQLVDAQSDGHLAGTFFVQPDGSGDHLPAVTAGIEEQTFHEVLAARKQNQFFVREDVVRTAAGCCQRGRLAKGHIAVQVDDHHLEPEVGAGGDEQGGRQVELQQDVVAGCGAAGQDRAQRQDQGEQ